MNTYLLYPFCLSNLSLYYFTVNQSRNPLRVNAGFLHNQNIGASRDIHFDFDQIHLNPDLDLTDFTGLVRLSRTPQGVLAIGEFKANMHAECVRCLEEYSQELHATFTELYVFKGHGVTEMGQFLPDDGTIDFSPLIGEVINLEIPIKPLCRPDCKGLCIMCGANLNNETCEHQNYVVEE
jgi:uncharacterized protein